MYSVKHAKISFLTPSVLVFPLLDRDRRTDVYVGDIQSLSGIHIVCNVATISQLFQLVLHKMMWY